MLPIRTLLLPALIAAALPQQADRTAERPIEQQATLFLEEMTWMEVRDDLKAGKTTIIIPTGGVEDNGPYIATGKHDYIVKAIAEAIAKKLGTAIVAPVVPFVPEGRIDPPTQHMKYPGTISLRESTYERLLTDICASMKAHGFRDIVLIGDSGGNQKGMKAVAAALNAQWAGEKARVHFIPEYYNHDDVDAWLAKQGIKQVDEGLHDDFAVTATLTAIDPTLTRAKQRQAAGKYRINGIDLAPTSATADWGRKIIEFRAEAAAVAIRKSIGVPRQ